MLQRTFKLNTHGFLIFLFTMTFMFCLLTGQMNGVAQSPNPDQLVQQGVDRYQTGDYRGAIAPWETALVQYRKTNNQTNIAIVLENLARTYQQLGQGNQAISYWDQVIPLYRKQGNVPKVLRSQIEQAQAYSSIGQPRQAISLLCSPNEKRECQKESTIQIARTLKDRISEVAALGSLGDAYRLVGNYKQAIVELETGLKLVAALERSPYQAELLNSLGNAYSSLSLVSDRRARAAEQRKDTDEAESLRQEAQINAQAALKALQESLKLAQIQKNLPEQMKTLLSVTPLYYRVQNERTANESLQQAIALLNQLPENRDRAYAAIKLVSLLQPQAPGKTQCLKSEKFSQAENLLQQAIKTSQRIQNRRAESFAFGELGYLDECQGKLEQALEMTQKARLAADQDLKAKDSLYLWEWQTGRILQKQGRTIDAIAAYDRAIATLESIRSDILSANRELQFDFRDTVEPIYRGLIALRLNLSDTEGKPSKSFQLKAQASESQNLNSVLSIMDSLKLAELQNYFGNECVVAAVNQTRNTPTEIDPSAAVLSTIISDQQVVVILKLPNQQPTIQRVNYSRIELERDINKFREQLETFSDKNFDRTLARKLYITFVAPFEAELKSSNITTLVFVQDGLLRSIPMAALYDGKQFLIEKYAIATTPSIDITDQTKPTQKNPTALALGVTQQTKIDEKDFVPLPYVKDEILGLKAVLPGSKSLIDADFQRDRLKDALRQQPFPIIHIATHGQFGNDPEDTFLVTGDSKKLTITDLDTLIREVVKTNEPIDLLTLTACQTAVGDDRSSLGLAGVAVQAGARSALASLWFINDATTATFTKSFYSNLNQGKAIALQKAQKELIAQRKHPAYWAPFILVGNWR